MKKILFFISAVASLFLAASCQQEEFAPAVNGGVTYEISLPTAQTKGANGYETYSLHYEVYKTIDAVELETAKLLFEKTVTMNGNSTTVTLDLLNDQDYTILFWANKANTDYFDLGDLRKVGVKQASANNDDRDAFCGMDQIENHDAKVSKTVTLTRPFAQINIATLVTTTDYDINPVSSLVKVKDIPVGYNVFTGKAVGDEVEVEYTVNTVPVGNLTVNGTDYKKVAMNYVLIPVSEEEEEDKGVVEVYYEINTINGTVKNSIPNVPVKKNYRTNIIGNLLTSNATYTVVVLPGFEEGAYVGPEFVQEPAYDAESKTWTVKTASELAWVAASVNGTIGLNTKAAAGCKTFKGETVRLANDIDLAGIDWTPIGNGSESARYDYLFAGTFDGNGKKISNMNVDYNHCAGLFGRVCGATIKNVTIDGFNLKADHYAGAIVGWVEQGATAVVVENCHVSNGTISIAAVEIAEGKHDLGDKAGAITGYSHFGKYTDNTATNVTITGYRDLGGIIGYGHNSVVERNMIENVTLVQDLEFDYKKDEEGKTTPDTLGDYIGRKSECEPTDDNTGNVTIYTRVADGIAVSKETITENGQEIKQLTYAVSNPNGLIWVANAVNSGDTFKGNTIELVADINLEGIDFAPIGYNNGDRKYFEGTFDGNNKTIKNLKRTDLTQQYRRAIGLFSQVRNAVVKNLTMEDFVAATARYECAVIACEAVGDCTFENLTFKNGSVVAFENDVAPVIGWANKGNFTLKGITVGSDVVIYSLWDVHGTAMGGLIGTLESPSTVSIENADISCVINAFNDVVSNYQWYAYRISGMLIGQMYETQTIDGKTYPDPAAAGVTCKNVTVTYGDWMNYHYCENEEYGKPSYAEEGQWKFKRVEGQEWGRESNIDTDNCQHDIDETHNILLPFDQLFGGGQNGTGRNPVYGLREYAGVTVNYPASYRREVSSATALTEALGKGLSVILDADVDYGTTQLAITGTNQVVDLGGHALTTSNNWGGISLKNGASIKNGIITHAGNTAAIKAFNGSSVENVTINTTCSTADKTVTGIAVQSGAHVESIKNVTINGVSQGIEVGYQATVDLIENVTVEEHTNGTANGIGLVINGGKVGLAKNSTFKGDAYGVTMHLKGVFNVGLELENCVVEGQTASIYAWDEKGVSNTSGSLNLTYDAATTLTGPFVWDFEEECQSVVTLNRPQ